MGNNVGNEIKYWINTATDAVRIWNVTDNPGSFGAYTTATTYPAGTLFKNVTVDENLKQAGAAEVYMVYDARDRLVMTQDGNLKTAKNGFTLSMII